MGVHAGTKYNALQRLRAAMSERDQATQNVTDALLGSDLPPSPQDRRRITLAKRRFSKAEHRVSVACTYWLQHHPLKDSNA